MRLTQLRSFYAVARGGGFAAAARLLHISQPTVTTQVRDLEEKYSTELFHRRGHKVSLTPLGKQLYELAQKAYAIEKEAAGLLEDAGELKSGLLRVGAVGPFHVTDMLVRFNRRYPGLQLSVDIGNSEAVLAALLAYRTEVAVLAQVTDDPRLYSVPYGRHPIVVFVNRAHRFASRRSIRIGELDGEPMIVREAGSTTRKVLDDALRKARVAPRVVMEIGSREAIREAVIKGAGIGAVSEREYIPDPALRKIPLAGADVHTHEHVVCLRERREARVVRAFFAIVEEVQQEDRRPGPQRLA